jgi:hypothetical protein
MDMINEYFSVPAKPYQKLRSSEALTKMPVDLLQNNQFKNKIT